VGTRGKRSEPTSCDQVLDNALANLKIAIDECQAVITREPLPVVLGDPVQLTQLFQNLIGNALKFRGEQPPVIHQRPAPLPPQRRANWRPNREWAITVRDNGIGIEPRI
jgi:light-regulated signal transduction histidine kinase (bacteriophytochrome)